LKLRIVAALLCAAIPFAASAASLENGEYRCVIGSYYLGSIEIKGNKYRGPAFDGNYERSYKFSVAGQTIQWGGPLGGISEAGKVQSTVLKDAGNDRLGFDILILNDRGNYQTISCYPE
jgi:hypothetical protein